MKKVMIVEDNPINMQLFSDILEASGYEVIQVTESTKAVEEIISIKPDIVLTDIQMPVISGLELTKMIKSNNDIKNIPVIAITAFAMKGDEEKILEAGCDGYIAKPISIKPFLETVAKFTS